MDILVSIIMTSHNRYPQNLLGLYALELQTFDLSKMEVILIDDASTDDTSRLRKYIPPYSFQYIKNKRNVGVACSRNIGIKKAKGKIIIILDAEMVVDPDYVKNHYKHHLTQEEFVVVGGEQRANLYSHIFPSMSSTQIRDVCQLAKKHNIFKIRLKQKLDKKVNSKNIHKYIQKLKQPIRMINKADIKKFTLLPSFSVPNKNTNELLTQLGKNIKESPIRWLACVGNLSLKRELANKIGGYDNDFKKWGTEDVEFAYRLYKAGAQFVIDPDIIRFHQEHPYNSDRIKQGRNNRILLQKKHPVLEVCIRSLKSIQKLDYVFMDKIVREQQMLQQKYPDQYSDFTNSMVYMLQKAAELHAKGKKIHKLFYGLNKKEIQKLWLQRKEIQSYGNYNNLVRLFDILVKR